MSITQTEIQKTLEIAVGHHEAGNSTDAEALYRQVLEVDPRNAAALNLLGVLASQVGRPDVAVDLIVQAIDVAPGNPMAHYNLANAYLAMDQEPAAERHFKEAILLQPTNAAAHYNLGVILMGRRDMKGAEDAFRSAIGHAPTLAQAWCNLGFVLREQDQHAAAIDAYHQGLSHDPTITEARSNLANILARLGRVEEAIASFATALKYEPTSASTYANLASTLSQAGWEERADRAFRASLTLEPASANTLHNHGINCKTFKEMADAEKWFRAALKVAPGYVAAAYNLGTALLHLARSDEARQAFYQVVRANPIHKDAWGNLGITFQASGQPGKAQAAFQKHLCLEPRHPDGLRNIAIVQQTLRRLDSAVSATRRALVVDRENSKSWEGHAIALQRRGYVTAEFYSRAALCLGPSEAAHYINHGILCQEAGRLFDAEKSLGRALVCQPPTVNALLSMATILSDLSRFDAAVSHGLKAIELAPDVGSSHQALFFYLQFHPTFDPAESMRLHRRYDDLVTRPLRWKNRAFRNDRDPNKRLRIGYIGPSFYTHSSNHFFEPLLINHDHDTVEIHCYAEFLRQADAVTDRFRGYADHWTTTFNFSDEELAEKIRADGIDILVELAGHTSGNRLGAVARKPAPVSFHWLDHLLTTGLSAIDYILGDPVFIPPGSERFFSEKPWCLPRTVFPFRPDNADEPVGPSPAAADGFVTFGTLSRSIRMHDRMIETLARVLVRTPKSRLLVFSKNYQDQAVRDDLIGKFGALGVESGRLTLGYHPRPAEIYRQIDIALDCFPHGSGVTLFEHAFMGHPVVTLRGTPAVGTVGSSLLTNIGHREWIAETRDQYVDIAADLARDIPHLAWLRENLRPTMMASPVMDGPGFARDFENACRGMWKNWCESVSKPPPPRA